MAQEGNKERFIKNDSLKNLVENYKSKDVVSNFEKAINFSNVKNIPLANLELYPLFDEKNYSRDSLEILSRSVKNNGFMFPIFIYKFQDKYMVINGVKRFLVARLLKYDSINSVIIEADIEEINNYIINNMLINNDNGIVLANAYDVLRKQFELREAQIRKITGLSHGQINNTLRLLALTKEVKKMLIEGKISYAKARLLVVLSKEDQLNLANLFYEKNYSVRECEKIIRSHIGENSNLEDNVTKSIKNDKLSLTFDNQEELEKALEILESKGYICK